MQATLDITSDASFAGHAIGEVSHLLDAEQQAKPAEEIEIKMTASASTLKQIGKSALVRDAAIEPVQVKQLETRYFDTPTFTLRSHGLTLRLRHRDEGWKQTLKTHVENAECLFHRIEWNKTVDRPVIDLEAIPPQAWPGGQCPVNNEDLVMMSHTEITRTRIDLNWPDSESSIATIELCLDQGRIIADDQSEPISEVELELVKGPQAALFTLEDRLQAEYDVECSTRSKSDRGFALFGHPGRFKAV